MSASLPKLFAWSCAMVNFPHLKHVPSHFDAPRRSNRQPRRWRCHNFARLSALSFMSSLTSYCSSESRSPCEPFFRGGRAESTKRRPRIAIESTHENHPSHASLYETNGSETPLRLMTCSCKINNLVSPKKMLNEGGIAIWEKVYAAAFAPLEFYEQRP